MKELEQIKKEIQDYYSISFDSAEDDYITNARIKNKIKDIIIDHKNDVDVIDNALLLLAETTGCAEDEEIAEKILDELFDNNFLSQAQLDLYYKNVGTNRWK